MSKQNVNRRWGKERRGPPTENSYVYCLISATRFVPFNPYLIPSEFVLFVSFICVNNGSIIVIMIVVFYLTTCLKSETDL